MAWLADLEPEQRLAVLQANAFAFPVLKNDRYSQAYIAEGTEEVSPSHEQHTEIVVAAMRMRGQLKKELAG